MVSYFYFDLVVLGKVCSRECLPTVFLVDKSPRQSPRTSLAKYSGLHFTDFLKVLLAVCFPLTSGDNDDNFSF